MDHDDTFIALKLWRHAYNLMLSVEKTKNNSWCNVYMERVKIVESLIKVLVKK